MASEEIVTNETLSGRIFKPPRTLALTSDGSLRLPPGSVIDFALANQVVLPDNLRTEIRDEIISQVSTDYLNGNLVHQNTNSSATNAVSTVVLGNNNADITGTTGLNNATYDAIFSSVNSYMNGAVANSQISSSSGSYIDNASAPAITYLDIDSSTNSYFQNTTLGGFPTMCNLSSCSACSIDDTQGNINNCVIHASSTSSIKGSGQSALIGGITNAIQRVSGSGFVGNANIQTNFTSPGVGRYLFYGGNDNTDLTGGYIEEAGSIWSLNSNLTAHTTPTTGLNRIVASGLIGASSCSLNFTTNPDGFISRSLITGSLSCNLDADEATIDSAIIEGSTSCNINGGSKVVIGSSNLSSSTRCNSNSLFSCNNTNITDLSRSAIVADDSTTTNFTNPLPAGERSRLFLGGTSASSLTGGAITLSGLLWAANNSFLANVAPATSNNRIVGSGIISSIGCTLNFSTNPNSFINYSLIGASTSSSIIGNTNMVQYGAILGSSSSTISNGSRNVIFGSDTSSVSNSNNCSIVTGQTSSITGSINCVAIGNGSIIAGKTNCLSWNGGTLTTDNQASFGGIVRVGGNITQYAGWISSHLGFVDTVRSSAVNTSLDATDDVILLSGTASLFLPLASVIGSNYPLDTSVKFKVIRTGTTNNILTTSPDFFNNITGFDTYGDTARTRTVEILLVNTTVSPHWRFADRCPMNVFVGSMTTDNTFGTTPVPKSDAAQLPTSTSQATHEALGATSYVYFEAPYGGGSLPLISYPVPPAAVTGVQLLPGLYKITYRYTVRTTSGGGNYRLRSDVRNNQSGLTIIGSYAETDGTNAIGGTRTVTVVCPEVVVTTNTIFTLRLSQDAASTISATAAISDPCFDIVGYL